MKKLAFLIVPLLLTACFPFDKIPEVKIKIDNSAISTIDSLEILYADKYLDEEHEKFKIYENNKELRVFTQAQTATIRLTLKDKRQIIFENVNIEKSKNRILISKVNEDYTFEQKEESKIFKYGLILLIILAIVFITKIPVALLIINPESKKYFMLKFGGLNLVYLAVVVILTGVFKDSFIRFLYPYYLVTLIFDLLFMVNFYTERGMTRSIIAGVVSNALFLTIGQLAITFTIMAIA